MSRFAVSDCSLILLGGLQNDAPGLCRQVERRLAILQRQMPEPAEGDMRGINASPNDDTKR